MNGEQQSYTGDWYAHEMAHAIDGPGRQLSSSDEWDRAWQADIRRDAAGELSHPVSRYASTSPSEGFAEFARLVYGVGTSVETLQTKYPAATAFFEKHGLLPQNGTSTETTVSEVFKEAVVDDDIQGDVPLAKPEPPKPPPKRVTSTSTRFIGKAVTRATHRCTAVGPCVEE